MLAPQPCCRHVLLRHPTARPSSTRTFAPDAAPRGHRQGHGRRRSMHPFASPRNGRTTDFRDSLLTVCWHAEHNATGLRPMSAMPPAAHARNMGHDARAGRPRLDRKSRSRQGSPRADSNALVSSGLRRHIPNDSRKADIGRIAWLRAAQRACVATPRGWFDSYRTIAQYGCEAGDGSVSVGPVASTATDQRSRSVGS
jgi:hypothetical protein